MTDLVRQSEENANRLRTLEAGMGQLKADQDQRISALEQRMSEAVAVAPAHRLNGRGRQQSSPPCRSRRRPSPAPPKTAETAAAVASAADAAASDPGEDAYSQGFHQWEAGQYDQAIYPESLHRRLPQASPVSYANNLIGRAQLDKGDARAAAATLLANYRSNPAGSVRPTAFIISARR